MKTLRTLIVITIVIFGFSATSFGQTTSSATASATATILKPLVITKSNDLSFGTIGADPSASKTVVLDAAGSRSASTATLYNVGEQAAAGGFSVDGTPNAVFTITLPSGVTNLTGPSGSTPMTIAAGATGWVHDAGTTPTLSATGTKTFKVGATLTVGAAQAPGNYTGSYTVTVNYN